MSELSARGKALERVIKEAAQAAEARMREPMACEHPRACYHSYEHINEETGAHLGTAEGCYFCDAVTQARAAEMERCCKALCHLCYADTDPPKKAETGWFHKRGYCGATQIRRGGGE